MENVIRTRRVKQNNQEFLIGVFTIRQIQDFTKYTERLIVGFKEIELSERIFEEQEQILPQYNPQIQRKTNNAKVERIANFLLTDPLAMFPTNIVIAIPQQVIDSKFENEQGVTEIVLNQIVKEELRKANGDVFLTIIDGQHRIRGIERAIEKINYAIDDETQIDEQPKNKKLLDRLLNLELIITFFIDPILEYQAMVFSTINKTQTKVPENLVFSLFGLTKDDTPQKTSLEVVLALNGIEKSPFFNRVKLVGGNYKRGESIPLSQATMVKSILFNICKNQNESEIERTKERKSLINNPHNLVFRPYYATNNDKMIVRIMYQFFSAVREVFVAKNAVSYWNLTEESPTNILQTNVGYQALMKILTYLLINIPENEKDSKDVYLTSLRKAASINWKDDGEEKRYPFTSKTINVLYQDILEKINS